jgi:hypothetical protein
MEAYEAWKEHKLTSQVDLSVAAFNLEQEGNALAWEAGAKSMLKQSVNPSDAQKLASMEEFIREENPYRGPGMRAAKVSGNKRVTS